MKAGAAALVLMILSIFLVPAFASAQTGTGYAVAASRELKILDGGNVLLTDRYNITVSPSSSSMRSFEVGFPVELGSKIEFVDAIDQSGSNFSTSIGPSPDNRSYRVSVTFATPVQPSQSLSLTLHVLFSDMIRPTQNFVLIAPRYPILSQNMTHFSLRVVFPEDSSFPTQPANYTRSAYQGLPSQGLVASNLPANSSRVDSIAFSSQSMTLIRCESFKRTVSLQPPQTIKVTDQYRIKNLATPSLSTITLRLVNGSSGVYAEDEIGPITSDYSSGLADVSTRIVLQQNNSYDFSVHFSVPYGDFVSGISGTSLSRLQIPIVAPSSNFSLHDVAVSVELPEGANYKSSEILQGSELNLTVSGTVLSLSSPRISTIREVLLRADFEYSILWVAYRPTLWVLAATAIVGSVLAFSRRRRLPVVRALPVPVETLKAFTSKYDEKFGLSTEVENLEKSMARGKVSRTEFRRRRTSIDARLASLNRELTQLKPQITKAGGRFSSAVAKIETAEAEIETTKGELERVSSQYRAGRISKETLERLRDESEKKMAKAKGNVDGGLAVFREEFE